MIELITQVKGCQKTRSRRARSFPTRATALVGHCDCELADDPLPVAGSPPYVQAHEP